MAHKFHSGIYPNEMWAYVHQKDLYKNIYSSNICNSPKLEITQSLTNNEMDKWTVAYLCKAIWKEQITKISGEPKYQRKKKSETKEYVMDDSIYLSFQDWLNYLWR